MIKKVHLVASHRLGTILAVLWVVIARASEVRDRCWREMTGIKEGFRAVAEGRRGNDRDIVRGEGVKKRKGNEARGMISEGVDVGNCGSASYILTHSGLETIHGMTLVAKAI